MALIAEFHADFEGACDHATGASAQVGVHAASRRARSATRFWPRHPGGWTAATDALEAIIEAVVS